MARAKRRKYRMWGKLQKGHFRAPGGSHYPVACRAAYKRVSTASAKGYGKASAAFYRCLANHPG